MTERCSDEALDELIAALQAASENKLDDVDRLLSKHPDDARLHFLRGSVLASLGRPIEALPALREAVELAPDFAIARFQLGFFQLVSAETANALSTWGPLALLPEDHYLRMFVAGLTHLIRDEFEQAIVQLRAGIAANDENPPLNRDMQLIFEQASALAAGARPEAAEGESASATSFLLDQLSGGSGKAH
jgi:tetratricopeptide (TPR) repeat protein